MKYYMSKLNDRDGYSRREILNPEKIREAVEGWLEQNNFSEALKKEGVVQNGQSYGNSAQVVIDTRDGEISTCTTTQNSYGNSDSFYIVLAESTQFDSLNDEDIIVDDKSVNVPKVELLEFAKEYNIDDFSENEDHTINIRKRDCNISTEDWCDYWSEVIEGFDDYEDRVEDCIDYYLEDCGRNWSEAVEGYYSELTAEETEEDGI